MKTPHLSLLNNAMQAYHLRTRALTSNIANLDTPGYQRLSVSFEDSLQEARRTVLSSQQPPDVEPRMEVQETPPILEDELMELADTQMRTQLATRALREHFELQRIGIIGRTG